MAVNENYPLSAAVIREESEKLFSRIKKVIIPKSMLKEIDGETNSYLVRYRLISEDKNRSSHWSPIFYVEFPQFVISRGKTEELGDIVGLSWEDPTNRPQYDIFVKYNFDDDYRFLGISTEKAFSVFRETNTSSISSVSLSNNVAQISTRTPHKLISSDSVTIAGLTGSVSFINGSYSNVTIVNDYTFSVPKVGSNTTAQIPPGVAVMTAPSRSLTVKIQVSATIKKIYDNLVIYESDEVSF